MRSSASKIELSGFDDLFQVSGGTEPDGRTMQDIPLSELFPFKNHPFQVRDDEAMQKTVESIARSGVLSPVSPCKPNFHAEAKPFSISGLHL